MAEPVMLGKDNVELRKYVRLVLREGEGPYAGAKRLAAWLATSVPGKSFAYAPLREHADKKAEGPVVAVRAFVLEGPAVVGAADLVSVEPITLESGGAAVAVSLGPDGAKRFEDATAEWGYRRLAIVLDDQVTAAPTVVEPITGGKLQIAIGGAPDEQMKVAKKLASKIEAARGSTTTPAK